MKAFHISSFILIGFILFSFAPEVFGRIDNQFYIYDDAVIIYSSLNNDYISGDAEDMLEDGGEITLTLIVQIFEDRTMLPDKLLDTFTVIHKLSYDLISKVYSTNVISDGKRIESHFKNLVDAMRSAGKFDMVSIMMLDDIDKEKRYVIKANVFVDTIKLVKPIQTFFNLFVDLNYSYDRSHRYSGKYLLNLDKLEEENF